MLLQTFDEKVCGSVIIVRTVSPKLLYFCVKFIAGSIKQKNRCNSYIPKGIEKVPSSMVYERVLTVLKSHVVVSSYNLLTNSLKMFVKNTEGNFMNNSSSLLCGFVRCSSHECSFKKIYKMCFFFLIRSGYKSIR